MLLIESISKTFYPLTSQENRVFSNLSLKIDEHDFVTIVGSNGAGKSTLLNLIAGSIIVDDGSISIDGRDFTRQPEHMRAKRISRVFQNPAMGTSPSMTVEENLALASANSRASLRWGITSTRRREFERALADIPLGLEKRIKAKAGLLSGGQRQALSLVMATMRRPKLLLLDEHTAALDPETARHVNRLTTGVVERFNMTTLMVTHNLENAIAMGNRLIMMHRGKIVLDVSGAEKRTLTVQSLLQRFRTCQNESFSYDRAILAD